MAIRKLNVGGDIRSDVMEIMVELYADLPTDTEKYGAGSIAYVQELQDFYIMRLDGQWQALFAPTE